ncbi:hypothetical protein ACTPOK_33835 [Streptomyces inhibens]
MTSPVHYETAREDPVTRQAWRRTAMFKDPRNLSRWRSARRRLSGRGG